MKSVADDGTVHEQLCVLANNDKDDFMDIARPSPSVELPRCRFVSRGHGYASRSGLQTGMHAQSTIPYTASLNRHDQPTNEPVSRQQRQAAWVYLTMCAYLHDVCFPYVLYLSLYKVGMNRVPFITFYQAWLPESDICLCLVSALATRHACASATRTPRRLLYRSTYLQ